MSGCYNKATWQMPALEQSGRVVAIELGLVAQGCVDGGRKLPVGRADVSALSITGAECQ